jgi:hypothetical protein
MTPFAYHAGQLAVLDMLGLQKLAVIGAKTMLPRAMSVLEKIPGATKAEQYLSPDILAALKTTGRTPKPMWPPAMQGKEQTLYKGVADMSPAAQTMHAMGPASGGVAGVLPPAKPGQTALDMAGWDKAIRAQVTGKLTPQDMGALRSVGSQSLGGAEVAGGTIRPGARVKKPMPAVGRNVQDT